MSRYAFGILFGLLVLKTAGVEFSKPTPNHRESYVRATPLLGWVYSETNLLSNGGFEQGLEMWTVTGLQLVRGTAAAEGTNYLAGRGTLSRTVELPTGYGALSLNFKLRGYGTLQFSVLSAENEQLTRASFDIRAVNTSGDLWLGRSIDLAEFAGQTVKLVFQLTSVETTPLIDDIQINPTPRDVVFDIYLGSPYSMNFLGRTNSTSWSAPRLLPWHPYTWRVEAITTTSTNRSRNWEFTTGSGYLPEGGYNIALEGIPAAVCTNEPLNLLTFFTDVSGFATPLSRSKIKLFATAADARPASILITEVNMGDDALEFVNASTQTLSLSNWTVVLYDSQTYTNGVSVRLPTNAVLTAGQLFTMVWTQAMPEWPTVRMPSVTWGDAPNGYYGAVVLRDRQSNLVDCVVIDQAAAVRGLPVYRHIPWLHWNSQPITNFQRGMTYSRTGMADSNTRVDWVLAPASIGQMNSGVTLPFLNGFGEFPFSPNVITNLNPVTTNLLEFSTTGSNVIIYAERTNYPYASGRSAPFQLLSAERCAEVTGPSSLVENSSATFELKLASATPHEIRVPIRSSDSRRLPVPESILIPAGASAQSFSLTVPNDDLLQGLMVVTLFADPPGYASSSCEVSIEDDDKAEISVSGPERIVEGQPQVVTVKLDRTPAVNVALQVSAEPPWLVQISSIAIPAGTREAQVQLGYDDRLVGGDTLMRLTFSHANWTPGQYEAFYVDDDHPEFTFYHWPELVEGSTNQLGIGFGGYMVTNVTVRLRSSDESIATVAATFELPAYQEGWAVPIVFHENNLRSGFRDVTITASADGWETKSVTLRVLDNDPAYLSLATSAGPWAVGAPVKVYLRAHAVDGRELSEIGLQSVGLEVMEGGRQLASRAPEPPLPQQGYWSNTTYIDEPSTGAVIRAWMADLEGASRATPVWTVKPQSVSHAAYDSVRDRFVVAVRTNELITIGPADGTQLGFNGPIQGPGRFGITEDRQHVVGVDASGGIMYQANLATLANEKMWSTTLQQDLYASTILPVPGRNDGLFALRYMSGMDGSDVALYIDGKEIGNQRVAHNTASSLGLSADRTRLFVAEPDRVSTHFLDADFTFKGHRDPGFTYGYDRWLRPGDTPFGNELFMTPHLQVFDPEVPGFLKRGNLEFRSSAAGFDPEKKRFALLVKTNENSSVLTIYEPNTFQALQNVPVLDLPGAPELIAPAGEHGWLIVAANQLFVQPLPESESLPDTDLAISGAATPLAGNSRTLQVELTVTNSGPAAAENVIFALALPTSAIMLSNPEELRPGTAPLDNAFLLGTIPINGSRSIAFQVTGTNSGLFQFSAFVGGKHHDTEGSNNRVLLTGPISLTNGPVTPVISVDRGPNPWQLTLTARTQPGWLYTFQWQSVIPTEEWIPMEQVRATGDTLEAIVGLNDAAHFFRLKVEP